MNVPVRSRIGFRVGGRTVDVAIPAGTSVHEALREIGVDLDDPAMTLVDSTGQEVDRYSTTVDHLPDGSVLHVVTRTPSSGAGATVRGPSEPAAARPTASPWWLAVAGAGAVVLTAVAVLDGLGGGQGTTVQRPALVVVLAAVALALAFVTGRPGASGPLWPTVVAALAGAAAGVVSVDLGLAGAGRLMVLTALVGALVPTAVRWAMGRRTRDEAADLAAVLLVVLGIAAGVTALALLLDLPAAFPAAVLLGLTPLGLRALPSLCVDVPDDQLVDVTLVARTVSTVRAPAHEPLGAVNDRMVVRTVHSAENRRIAGTVLLSLAAPVLVPVVLVSAEPGLTGWASLAACGLVAVALALSPRTARGPVARWAPRVGALVMLVELAALGAGGGSATTVTLVAVAMGLGVAALSLPIGRGWRSVGFSRLADAMEGLATVLALPVALVGAGAIEAFRLMTS